MSICDSILDKDIMASCDANSENSFNRRAYIFNFDDLDKSDVDYSAGKLTGALKMKSGKRGYIVEQANKNPYEGTNTALAVGTYRNSYTHQVKLFIPDTSENAEIIDAIGNGRFVVVLNHGNKPRVYGWFNGLEASEMTQAMYNEESDGGWVVTLQETKAKFGRAEYDEGIANLEELCKVVS